MLTTSLRVICPLVSAGIEELSYDEYLAGLADASVTAVLSMEPWKGRALLSFDLATLLTIVDHQLGGPGTAEQPDRPLTDIEQAITRQLLVRMLRELSVALEPLATVTPQLISLESNAGFVQAAAPTDPVVVALMDLTIGTRESQVSLCIPFAMLSPALDQLSRSSDSGEKARIRMAATRQLELRLSDVEVDVAVRFDPLRMASEVVGRLQVGDVVTLGHRTSRPMSVTSAATTFARAVPGTSGKKLAVLIVEPS